MHMIKRLASVTALVSLVGMAAHAKDEFYSIESGNAAAQIGEITGTGFFETSGFGSSTAGNGIVIGFDLTLSEGGNSITLCSNAAYGCVPNDILLDQVGVVADSKGLRCVGACYLTDIGNGLGTPTAFTFYGGGSEYQLQPFPFASSPKFLTGFVESTDTITGNYVIAGGAPTTTQPVLNAPEISPASASAGLTLLLGCLAVLRGRRPGQRVALKK
jgi:hypothetical protein